MIYTLGNKKSYDQGIKALGITFKKLGKNDTVHLPGYLGGSVWRTFEEVEQYLKDNQPRLLNYAVYEVHANWSIDTYPFEDEPFRRLLNSARITAVENT